MQSLASPPPRTADADVKREAILRVAEHLFAEHGYEGTTIDRIARQLGVTKPYVYYYFRNKQELFEMLAWRPAVACFTVLDDPALTALPASRQVALAIERLIHATLRHLPAAFFTYREQHVMSPAYLERQKRLARHFYDRLCVLLEQARADGDIDFRETRITALAACSLPGFLYTWYRADGPLSGDAVARELTELAWRVVGLNVSARARRPSIRRTS